MLTEKSFLSAGDGVILNRTLVHEIHRNERDDQTCHPSKRQNRSFEHLALVTLFVPTR
jgi:hypothetical protein